jgi:glycosyltransferase involved in cell wall biosynthesis
MNKHDFTHETLVPRRPHNVAPSGISSVHLLLVTHLMPKMPGSDTGLSVIINSTARVLRSAGVHCECRLVQNANDLFDLLEHREYSWSPYGGGPVTHVVVNTYGFLPARDLANLTSRFTEIEFIVLNHSGQSFIHIDPSGIGNIKDSLELQISSHNLRVAGNNKRFKGFVRDGFGRHALYLPNLYDLSGFHPVYGARRDPDPLFVGTFGALREAKNQSIAQQAAMGMARRLGGGRPIRLEWHVNAARFDSSNHILLSRQKMFEGLDWAKLVEHPWGPWNQFLKIAEQMDVLLMPSFDETFCCVAADAAASGVPVVCTGAMDWAPRNWISHEPYDPADVMRVGLALLHDRSGAAQDGAEALKEYVADGTRRWINYLIRNEE